jgi:hypothetical protein
LSQPAQQQLAALKSAPETADPLSRELRKLANDGNEESLLEVLSPALCMLDERLRLKLVDRLLEASTQTVVNG